ncbi:MAG: DUF2087 domain-containing protein [Armatimonadetes bacterium]|nr:DUF2087 domain-containing protein [Armatimonadota bacterium]
MINDIQTLLKNHLDDEGKLSQWPSKGIKKQAALQYIASKFERGADYTEAEVNAMINQWHTFNDTGILRKELINNNFLFRQRDGQRYWRGKDCELFSGVHLLPPLSL